MDATEVTLGRPASGIVRKTIKPTLPTLIRNKLRRIIIHVRHLYLTRLWNMDIHPETIISLKVHLDKSNPKGIHIGRGTMINFGASILSHDYVRRLHTDTWIGEFCGIGAHSVILPGLCIGDHSIVAAGAVVTKDVPPHTIVAGNPAKVIREGIDTVYWGRLKEHDDGNHA